MAENPNHVNTTLGIRAAWAVDWVPLEGVVITLSSLLIALGAVWYGQHPMPIQPEIVELRGDLDILPDVIATAPHSLHYIVITDPSEKRCAVCNLRLEEGEPFSRCPRCGIAYHRDHLLDWVRARGYCPACRRRLGELDILNEG